ncbi:MAG: metallophosphoesterase, partial [Acidobacteriota bacterium]|nr:metallophosphoesterase [Acidobacteriota bacterium]
VNFAVLPGDNANEGSEEEYRLIQQATDQLRVPLYAVPGDHDARAGLQLFTRYLEPVSYQSFTADRYHFSFLNALDGGGRGGFGIGQHQLEWLTQDLAIASKQGLQSILFMHAFPSQLQESGPVIQMLIQKNRVLMVDVGHTHYNHIANDGHTIYAATRSTGQAHEGPVGFSITNLDHGVVSWKFKPLGDWPFAMITSPSDKQLITDPSRPDQVLRGTVEVRAKIWDDQGVSAATYQIDNGTDQPLTRIGKTQMWSARCDSTKLLDGDHQIVVNVRGAGGNVNEDRVYVVVSQAGTYQIAARQHGDQGNSIGAYVAKGLLGTVGGPPPGGPGGNGQKGGAKGPPPPPRP